MEKDKGSARWMAAFALIASALLASCDSMLLDFFAPKDSASVNVFDLDSSNTGTKYRIYVGLPASYGDGSVKRYPVALCLDGDYYSKTTMDIARDLAARGKAKELIIVGIGYGDGPGMRERDYTPTRDASQESGGIETGGAEAFLAFIRAELLPRLEGDYRLASGRADRMIVGHSYGGLFSLYAMTTASDSFGAFIAASPSVQWDDGVAYGFPAILAASGRSLDCRVFTCIGSGEASPSDLYVKSFNVRLSETTGIAPTYKYYANSIHEQIWEWAYRDALAALMAPEAAR